MTQPGIPEFGAIRRRLQGQFSQRKQEQDDALQRRFAASGMMNSGAAQKIQAQGAQELARAEADANVDVDMAESQELQRRKEIAEGRDFARSEREATQKFSTGERLGAQQFQQGMFDKESAFKERVFREEMSLKWKELDESINANRLNAAIALDDSGMDSDDLTDALYLFDRINKGGRVTAPASRPTNLVGGRR